MNPGKGTRSARLRTEFLRRTIVADLERVVVAEVLVAHVEADGASLATSAATRPAMCRRASVRILEMPTIAQQMRTPPRPHDIQDAYGRGWIGASRQDDDGHFVTTIDFPRQYLSM